MPFVTASVIALGLIPTMQTPARASRGLPAIRLASHFRGLEGCFLLRDLKNGWTLSWGEPRCEQRLSPCSTFKIFNALAGLESGVLVDEHTRFAYDGTPQPVKVWQQDHTLASAIQNSVVWYFRRVAQGVGEERMAKFLHDVGYGNEACRGRLTDFWIDGTLEISPREQLEFLTRLYSDRLPFQRAHMALVRRLLVQRASGDWSWSGKTGTQGRDNQMVMGWFVGQVRSGPREFVFVTNIAASHDAGGRQAREITWDILKEMRLVRD
ncbi:MAG: penicillin-binding transpeptidase domain-containing protein [Phycisphaerae bacterium]